MPGRVLAFKVQKERERETTRTTQKARDEVVIREVGSLYLGETDVVGVKFSLRM